MLGEVNSGTRLIAMLVDGDNAQPSLIEHVLAETAKYGVVTTRRIYGDWTTPQMSSWKQHLHTQGVRERVRDLRLHGEPGAVAGSWR